MENARPFRSSWILLVAGLIWLVLGFSMLVLQAWVQRGAWSFGSDRGGDLKQHYAVGVMLQNSSGNYTPLYRNFVFSKEITRIFSQDLYTESLYLDRHNYRYSPLIAWISWKLLALPYGLWVKVWGVLSIAWAVAGFVLIRKAETGVGEVPPTFLEAVLFLGFPPLLYGFSIFQNAPLTLFMAAAAAWLLKNRHAWIAGFVFGSICYKPQLLPYIAGIMLLCGQWRFAIGTGLASGFWLGMGLLLCGAEAHRHWLESLLEIVHGLQGDEMETNMPWKGFILTVLPENFHSSGLMMTHILGLLSLGLLVFFAHRIEKHSQWRPHHIFYLALLWWLLFTPHVKAYELVLALPAMMLLFRMTSPHQTMARAALALFYISGFAVVSCRFVGFSPGAPLVTGAFLMTLSVLSRGLEGSLSPNKISSQ